MCTWIQLPKEARSGCISEAIVTGLCEFPGAGAGNSRLLQEQEVLLTTSHLECSFNIISLKIYKNYYRIYFFLYPGQEAYSEPRSFQHTKGDRLPAQQGNLENAFKIVINGPDWNSLAFVNGEHSGWKRM